MSAPWAFGQRLKQLRQEHGLTQETLADRVGCATQTIRKLEAGSRRPSYQMAARLADVLGVAPDERAQFIRFGRENTAVVEAEAPAQRSEPARAQARLPTPLTRLIAREQEVMAVQRMLRGDELRLLTLVGPGGTGKTRLALEVAAALEDAFADGVVFVNLVPLRDPGLVVPTIADALGVGEEGGTSRIERLKEALHARQLLLVLDNFEQLMPAAAQVAELLWACTGVKMLVTSRELLRVRGEQAFSVAPLPVPDARYAVTSDRVSQYAAVQLFIERALAVRPDFAVTNANAPAVAELCQRLDGLPLAIELAAARSTLFTPEALLARLGSRLKLLTGGARDLPARHQTLHSTIAWSYDLLSDGEQKLFRRMSVFVGGRTLAAAEAVCAAAGDLDLDVIDGLESLVLKSLLWRDAMSGDEPRFLMLETIWEYGREQLERSGEAEATRRAHAEHYLRLVEQAERHLWGGEQGRTLAHLEREHDNLRAALAWFIARDDGAEPALRMAGLLWRFWEMRGHWTEGQQWLEQALARRLEAPPDCRWIALHGAGNLALDQGEYARAKAYYEESLIVTRELGLARGIGNSLLNLSIVALYRGNYAESIALQEEALAIFRASGNNVGIAISLSNLVGMFEQQADYDRALATADESLARYAELRDSRGRAMTLHNIARVERRRGSFERARELLEESLAIYHTLDARSNVAGALNDLGALAADEDEWDSANTLFAESYQLATELGDRRSQAAVLNNIGRLALRMDDVDRAVSLCSKSLALRRELGDKHGAAVALESLGYIASRQDDATRAAPLYQESLALAQVTGDRVCIARSLEGLAEVARICERPERSARLFAAAAALRQAHQAPLAPHMLDENERVVAAVRAVLGEQPFAATWAEAQAMPVEQAIAYALERA